MNPILHRSHARTAIALFIYSVFTVNANADLIVPGLSVSGGLESFYQKEISSNGKRLISESGSRVALSIALDNPDRYDPSTTFLYHLEATIYGGRVDYDGQSQGLAPLQGKVPFNSETEYRGGRAEALLGYRLQNILMPRPLEILGGLGVDAWNRRIQSGTANNTPVNGIEETYEVVYGKIGLGMTDLWTGGGWHDHLQMGVKIPLDITEDVNLHAIGYDSDVTLSPGNAYSTFIGLTLKPPAHQEQSGNLLVKIYYEGLRFDPSPIKAVNSGGSPVLVRQPETRIDIFGIQAGYQFK